MVAHDYERLAVISAGSAWGREACRVLALAEQRGLDLGREDIIHYDVRDLQQLGDYLRTNMASSTTGRASLLSRDTVLARASSREVRGFVPAIEPRRGLL